ncbi:Ger(x)C family spore germination protein [Paenibacillus cremeus]|uniref:Ger(X)C family spore germination protein n=1 Tax=Paenibacillus cremeus TaxID=2163881 RepID=A0A559K0C1_9BACL|nr:Ger(x)C family spore germination protein [Paenibacillus cremeus]TVY05594.1 Ger(x)C family spore germination protein [Paenibacillus cremeus]
MKTFQIILSKWVSALLPVFLVLLPGCGFKDIDKRFFVVTLGIDKPTSSNKLFKVSVKLAIPSPQERFGSNQSIIVTEEANSVTEAVRIIKSKVDKELDFGYTKAFVFGESLLNEDGNLYEIMDWVNRRRDIQLTAWMAMGKPDALSVLQAAPRSERLPSNMLFLSFGQSGTETAYIVSEYLFDFFSRLKERGKDPILPIIERREDDQVSINRLALFNKQKHVATLSPYETKIFNSFYEQIGKVDIPIKYQNNYVTIDANTIRTKYSIQNADSAKPVVHLTIKILGLLEESRMPVKLSELQQIEKVAEQELQLRVLALFKKLQKAGVDPIGIGLRYRASHRTDQGEWEQWQEKYSRLDFQVYAQVKLMGTGVIE